MKNTPLYICPSDVAEDGSFIADNAQPIAYAPTASPMAYAYATPSSDTKPQATYIGIVHIYGGLYRDGYYDSYERIANQILELDANPRIKSILIRVQSPGGTANGAAFLAEVIASATKPTLVHGSKISSAAYFAIAGADLVVLDNSAAAQIGSIGCLLIHQEDSARLEREGVALKIIRATGSEQKNLANSHEPLSTEAELQLKDLVDRCRAEFVGYVNRYRAGKIKSEALTGLEFSGADALRFGLVDKVDSLQNALKLAATLKKK